MINVFTGKNGRLSPSVDTGTEGDAAKAVFDVYKDPAAGSAIARVTNVEVYVETDLEEFHQIGQRLPVSLHAGDVHIHGKIGRAYVSGAMLSLLLGKGVTANPSEVAKPYVQPVFKLTLDLDDPADPATEAQLVLDHVKLQNWAQSVPEEGFVMENVTFRALTIQVIDKDKNGAKNPAFA